jgi:hypothetical protein
VTLGTTILAKCNQTQDKIQQSHLLDQNTAFSRDLTSLCRDSCELPKLRPGNLTWILWINI